MSSKPLALAVALTLGLAARPAFALDWAANAGLLEVVALPGPTHAGLYPNVGVSALVPWKKLMLIPSLSVEWAPENSHAGLVFVFDADYALNDLVGLDAQVLLLHDQPGLKFDQSAFFAGVGVGCSFFLGSITLSPFLDVTTQLGAGGLALVPGANAALAL